MVVVKLMNDYFVEVDDLNHTLKQNYVGETKDGQPKVGTRVIGYYPNLPSCVEKMAREIVIDENDCQYLSIKEYAQKVEDVVNRVYQMQLTVER